MRKTKRRYKYLDTQGAISKALSGLLLVVTALLAIFNLLKYKDLNDKIAELASINQLISESIPKAQLAQLAQISQKKQDEQVTFAVAKILPAVVSVFTSNLTGQSTSVGSGFIISHKGYIVTNKHVVGDSKAKYSVTFSTGEKKAAQIVYRDPTNDIAILKIAGAYPTIAVLGNSDPIAIGQSVVAIGNALGKFDNSVSVGIVSGLNRTTDAVGVNGTAEKLTGVIQTDAVINPGNSGGPLVDLSGNVIGVNVAIASESSNISFAIPINSIKSILAGYQ
jgi:S1-C subfamily serine protease